MPVNDPYELQAGIRLVNEVLLDARRYNLANQPYNNTAQVLSENPLAIRVLGQIYYVDDGAGGITPYWFKNGTADPDLEEMFIAADQVGLVQQDAIPNVAAWYNTGHKFALYDAYNVGADSIDFQNNPGDNPAVGVPGLSCMGFGYFNLVEGEVNTVFGFQNTTRANSGYSFVYGSFNELGDGTSPSNHSMLVGYKNKDGSSLFGQAFALGVQNEVRDGGMAYGSVLSAHNHEVAVGIGGERLDDMAFRVGISGLEPGSGDLVLTPGTENNNGLVTWRDGSNEAPQCSIADIDARGAKALVTKEYLGQAIDGLTSITYIDLLTLYATNSLIVGKRYLLNDFKTVYKQPVSGVVSDSAQGVTDGLDTAVEPLIVTAVANNELHIEAKSTLYPDDIIHYKINFDFSDGGSVNQKGSIIYRKDALINIEFDYDWRNVKTRLYSLTADGWDDSTNYSRNDTVKVGNRLFLALRDNIGQDPNITDGTQWMTVIHDITSRPDLMFNTTVREYDPGDPSKTHYFEVDELIFKDVYTIHFPDDPTNSSGIHASGRTVRDLSVRSVKGDAGTYTDYLSCNVFILENIGTVIEDFRNFSVHDVEAFQFNIIRPYQYFDSFEVANVYAACEYNYITGIIGTSRLNRADYFDRNFIRGIVFTDFMIAGLKENVMNIKVDDLNVTTRMISNLEGDFVNNTIYTTNWIHDYREMRLINCVITGGGIRNGNMFLLKDGEVSQYLQSVDLDATYWGASSDFNPGTKITQPMINCYLRNMNNCTLGSIMNSVYASEWQDVVTTVLQQFVNVKFEITRWYGKNTWLGNPVVFENVKVTKKYSDNPASPTVEKLWYETVDINGVTTLNLME